MQQKFLPGLFAGVLILASSAATALSPSEQAIQKRIKPVGEVCLVGDDSCSNAAAPVASGPRSGDEIYQSVCMGCHDTGAAGAPKRGDQGAWSARVGQGMDQLIANAINGINMMPPKGTCGNCSDEEIGAAVEYLVNNSK